MCAKTYVHSSHEFNNDWVSATETFWSTSNIFLPFDARNISLSLTLSSLKLRRERERELSVFFSHEFRLRETIIVVPSIFDCAWMISAYGNPRLFRLLFLMAIFTWHLRGINCPYGIQMFTYAHFEWKSLLRFKGAVKVDDDPRVIFSWIRMLSWRVD